jgi:hypothetical protein
MGKQTFYTVTNPVKDQTSTIMTHAAHKAYSVTQQMGHEIQIGLGIAGFLPGMALGFANG